MRDELDERFLALVFDSRHVVWAEADRVREWGARRTRRRTAAIGLALAAAVLATIGATWAITGPAAVSPRPGVPTVTDDPTPPSPTPDASPTASPTAGPGRTTPPARSPIPDAAMLRGDDVGSDYRVDGDGGPVDHGSIPMLMAYCGEHDYTDASSHVGESRNRSVGDGSGERYVLQNVDRYEAGWAARHLADLRAVLPRCQTVNIQGDPNARSALTVVASGFTGDDSLLIRDVRSDLGNEVQYLAVVRRGDVETRLRVHIGVSEAEARRVAIAAGERLCAATPC